MSQTKQITNYALHTFLEQVEQAILEGFRVHKTPTSYAKLIGGRYNVVMVKPAEDFSKEKAPEKVDDDKAPTKPTTRKTTKKVGDESES